MTSVLRCLGATLTGVYDKASHVLSGVARLGDQVLLLDAGVGGFKESVGQAEASLVLAVEIRQRYAQLRHRLLLIHESMMPHGLGHSDVTTCATLNRPP